MSQATITRHVHLQQRVEELAHSYLNRSKIRDKRLFTCFLPEGYRMTTLDSVDSDYFDDVILAKVTLGMLITLYDDLADHPGHHNPRLLKQLNRIELGVPRMCPKGLAPGEKATFELALELYSGLHSLVRSLPRGSTFFDLLCFDLDQVFLANAFSSLLLGSPGLRNPIELRRLGPYNMGMVAAGTIDLMASSQFDPSELGSLREILILAQRIGRIGNLLSTFEREVREGDLTSELLQETTEASLLLEKDRLLLEISQRAQKIRSIHLLSYLEGIEGLFALHLKMKGII